MPTRSPRNSLGFPRCVGLTPISSGTFECRDTQEVNCLMNKLLTLASIVLIGTVVTFGLKAHAQSTQSSSQEPSAQQQPSDDQQQQQQPNEQQKNEQQSMTREKPSPNQ